MKDEKEWLRQAADDMKSAEVLLKGGRYTHCVFFCHLAIEKALKAVYLKKLNEEPPKTHNLTLLLNAVEGKPPQDMQKLITDWRLQAFPQGIPKICEACRQNTRGKPPRRFSKNQRRLSHG